ncbi:MAG: magnesium transporter [Methanocalculus sp. MSAO_Arc1]|uniref:magnesium transporter n=1 Tax=Methanocalculus TaxID=71151 RepID=UPI000FF6887B|nr:MULTISPECIES: magnesium transporter [unclassified Methanocalculus]MCP1661638.1 magnesium transporter [Methanocalculus sp. AMF5]RQD81901.1 MAG: magnesium transporter [Methanocalculus sp. MSAO_Arc1]
MEIDKIRELLANRDWHTLRTYAQSLSRSEWVELFPEMDDADYALFFRLLDKESALLVFESLDPDQQARLITLMEDPETLRLVEGLDPDDQTRLFEELPAKITKRILAHMEPGDAAVINKLLGYPEGSAGRFMTSRYIAARRSETVGQVLQNLHTSPLRPDEMGVIFVIGMGRLYEGYIRLGSLLKTTPDTEIGELASDPEVFVRTTDTSIRAAELVSEYDIPAIAVLDGEGRLVGSITFDDAMDLLEEEGTEDFQKIGSVRDLGVNVKEATISLLYRKRIPWLMVLVLMNVFSGAGIAYYEETIEAAIALVFFLPLLIDSGGNAGSQSATLMVRSLAIGDVRMRDWFGLIGKEAGIAVALGVTLAGAVMVLGMFRGGPEIAVVVGLAMLIIILVGSLIGMTLPFVLARLNKDPAVASTPLVTSFCDITGVLIYFTIATWYLGI